MSEPKQLSLSSGRIGGMSARFNQADMEQSPAALKLKLKVTPTTWSKVFRRNLAHYCNFLGMSPDDIIRDRKVTMRSDEEDIQRSHEEKFDQFIKYMEDQRPTNNRKRKLAPNTVVSAGKAVKSFYHRNYHPLLEVELPTIFTDGGVLGSTGHASSHCRGGGMIEGEWRVV
ncbi:MAG: hypothetical protein ABSG92_09120 [Conexivisphaerales archaeon]|jgi:hypothetical protein